MRTNFFGNPIKWMWVMRKLNTPLSVSSYVLGTKMGKRVFQYPLHISATWYDFGDIYFDEEEIAAIKNFLRHHIAQHPSYPDAIARTIFKIARMIDKTQPPLATSLRRLPLRSLVALLKKREKFFLQMIGFMSYRGSIQMADILHEQFLAFLQYRLGMANKLSSEKVYHDILSVPLHESIIAQERRSMLALSAGFRQLSLAQKEKRVSRYLEKYAWMSYHWFIGTPPTREEVRDRMWRLAPQAMRQLRLLQRDRVRNESRIRRALAELYCTAGEKRLVRQYREWLFLRTFVKDTINLSAYKLLPILYAIADRLGVERTSVPFLTLDELHRVSGFSVSSIAKKIADRRNGFSAYIVGNTFSFGTLKRKKSQTATVRDSIRGATAYPGVVRAIVRVVLSPREQGRLRKGEILVTSMTTPDFFPAMERAAAFVTDEGGITCHAAIVARELKKPCVIGTKIATKVLKDGDRVEVDAERGIVKKIY